MTDFKKRTIISTDKEKRQRERKAMAYSIAKQICNFSETYWEVAQILGDAETIIKMEQDRKKPTVPEMPVDRWGNKLEMPDTKSAGQNKKD